MTLILIAPEAPPFRIPPFPEGNYIIVGYSSNIAAIDPLDTWDVPSHIAEHQVVEGLVDYNYSDHPNYAIVPKLAIKWHYHSAKEISFKLREGVWFHDGERWDADVAIWNFERLVYFCNYTGTLEANETSWEAFPAALYFFSNGTPLFDHFTKNSEYNFTIHLTGPFAAILDLLTFSATYMLSSKSTPRYRFLDLTSEKLVGTGPFKYIRYKSDVDVRFEVNPHYWGKSPWIDKLIFRIVEDDTARMNAGLAGQFDYISGVPKSYIPAYNNSPYFSGFNVKEVGEDLCNFYLEFYSGPPYNFTAGNLEPSIINGKVNQRLNSTWRRALSLTINYTYIWESLTSGLGFPGCPAVSRSMPSFNCSIEGKMAHNFPFDGTYAGNVKKAREIMQSMGYGIGWDTNFSGTNETSWISESFKIIKTYQWPGSLISQNINNLMEENFKLIGVNLDIWIPPWECGYLFNCYPGPGEIDMRYTGWCPDCLDAFYLLDPLLNNQTNHYTQIDDPIL